MESDEKKSLNNEESGLIDFFTVLLRYRKLIICGSVICTFLVSLWLFVFPLIFTDFFEEKDSFKVTYTIKAVNPPSSVMQELGNDSSIAALSQLRMRQLKYILDQNRVNPVFKGQNKVGYEYNSFIKQQIEKMKFKVEKVVLGTEFDISCELEEDDFKVFESFVKSSVEETNRNLEEYIFPIMDNIDIEEHPEIISYKNNYKNFISIEGEPFILKNENTKGRIKKLVISFFIFFFIFSIVSFMLDTIDKIKQDKDASLKISEAWNEGKFKKNK